MVFPRSNTGAANDSQAKVFEDKKPTGLSPALPGLSIIAWHQNAAGGSLNPVKSHTVNTRLPRYWTVKQETWCWTEHLFLLGRIVLSPMRNNAGQEKQKKSGDLIEFIANIEKQRQALEDVRLLYVATTRPSFPPACE